MSKYEEAIDRLAEYACKQCEGTGRCSEFELHDIQCDECKGTGFMSGQLPIGFCIPWT